MNNRVYRVALIKEHDGKLTIRSKRIHEHTKSNKKYETDNMFQGYEKLDDGFTHISRRIYKKCLENITIKDNFEEIHEKHCNDYELAYTYSLNPNKTRVKLIEEFISYYSNSMNKIRGYLQQSDSIIKELGYLNGD